MACRDETWIPAPDQVEGRPFAGMAESNPCESGVNPCLAREQRGAVRGTPYAIESSDDG
jgi:hypothetical protein